MMKEFTPPRLRLLGLASNGLALFHYAQNGDYIHLQCSKGFKTYSISSRTIKNACLASFCSKIGQKLKKLRASLVLLLIAPQIPQNPEPS